MGQGVDVEATGRDLGGDEDVDAPGLEVAECPDPLALALVAVDRRGGDAVPGQLLGQPVRAVLGPREHERLVDPTAPDEVAEQLALALTIDRIRDLANELDRRVAAGDLDLGGVVEDAPGELADVVGERRREHEVLAPGRQQGEDAPDVADEAHVEHAIRLVEDQDLDRVEPDRAPHGVIEQPAGRRDDDLGAGPKGSHLRLEADTAVDRGGTERAAAAVGADALLDLERELSGRGEDEAADRQSGRAAGSGIAGGGVLGCRPAAVEQLEDRQDEGGRLAGAGLGAGEHVAPGEDERDGFGLDRGGLCVALGGDRAEKLGRQPESIEGHGGGDS